MSIKLWRFSPCLRKNLGPCIAQWCGKDVSDGIGGDWPHFYLTHIFKIQKLALSFLNIYTQVK